MAKKENPFLPGNRKFRPPGAPAGAWPPASWSHCVFHDPYERVNVWSHGIPGLLFLMLGCWCSTQTQLEHSGVLAVFSVCAAITHCCSALTHVYPDDHYLEKLDHVGIVALIAGTPYTAVLASMPGASLTPLLVITSLLLVAAMFPPLLRTLSFLALGAALVGSYSAILTPVFAVEVVLYVLGALFFIRGSGHERWQGFSDHHVLHYVVSISCTLHVAYILKGGTI